MVNMNVHVGRDITLEVTNTPVLVREIQLLLKEIVSNNNDNLQWCGNSQSCRTLSDKSSECPVNGNLTVCEVYGEQDKSGDNRPKCLVIGSLFPHP